MDYREFGISQQTELEEGGESPLLAARKCWLKPGATDQKRSVFEILSFRREVDADQAVLFDMRETKQPSSSGERRDQGS